uniref:Maturase K n=1 Tax=Euglenaformis proxima TaxID=299110 RepID=A0A023HHR8_9EUGL|nr:hypothetical protein FL48_p32 [Euglenaformis proxima]AGL12006.1 hypothetical protein [Euglenaformis proxima]
MKSSFITSSFFYLLKNKHSHSFFMELSTIHDRFYQSLWELFIVPILEVSFDRFSYAFRPFRNTRDVFFKIKNFYSLNYYRISWILKMRLLCFFSTFNKIWLLKNLLIEKSVLRAWFKKASYFSSDQAFRKNILSILANFTVSGLV